MRLDKSGKNENRMQKTVLACDMFTAAYSVMLLLFFLPYVSANGQWIASAFVPFGLILPFAVMPVLYALVHKLDPLLFGRYHLFMPLSALVSALLFVVFWSADGTGIGATKIALCAVAFGITTVMYRYCSFSVRVRLGGGGIVTPSNTSLVYAGVGGAAAIGTVVAFYFYDSATAFINSAYIVATAGVILAMVQYLTTFYHIPRLSGKRAQSVKSAFRTFYSGLNYRTFFSSIFTVAAFAIVAALSVGVSLAFLPTWYCYVVAGSLVGAMILSSFFVRLIKRRSRRLTAVIITLLFVSAALFALTEVFALFGFAEASTVIAACLCGAGSALAMRQMRIRFLTVKPRVTSGVVHILIELATAASVAIALAAAVVVGSVSVKTGELMTYVYGFIAAAVFGIAAVMTARIRRAVPGAPKEPSFEPNIAQQDGYGQK